MILKFMLDNITDKEADDLVAVVTQYLAEEGYMVSEYWVTEDE